MNYHRPGPEELNLKRELGTYLSGVQLDVAQHPSRRLLIDGISGHELTRVLCRRLIHFIDEGTRPKSIAVLTSSRGEQRTINRILEEWRRKGEQDRRMWLTEEGRRAGEWLERTAHSSLDVSRDTVDSFATSYLRREGAGLLDFPPHFSFWSQRQSLRCVSRVSAQHPDTQRLSTGELSEALLWRRRNTACTNRMEKHEDLARILGPADYLHMMQRDGDRWVKPVPAPDATVDELMRQYEEEMRLAGALDRDGVVKMAAKASYEGRPGFLDEEDAIEHLLVDGVQDLTPAAMEFVLQISQYMRSLTLTFTKDQSVSVSRGGDPYVYWMFLGKFEDHEWLTCKSDTQSQNILSGTLERLTQIPELQGIRPTNRRVFSSNGWSPRLRTFPSREQLLDELVEFIRREQLRLAGELLADSAILFRWPSTMFQCETLLREADVAYRVWGRDVDSMSRDARGALGLLTLCINPRDVEALRDASVQWTPSGWRELNEGLVSAIVARSREDNIDLVKAVRRHITNLRKDSAPRRVLEQVLDAVDAVDGMLRNGRADHTLVHLWARVHLVLYKDNPELRVRDTDIALVVRHLRSYDPDEIAITNRNLSDFLDDVRINGMPIIGRDNCITLSTIHNAHGRQWSWVRVVEAGEKMIPSPDIEGAAIPPLQLWEEQRILNFAASRALETLSFYNLANADIERIWERISPSFHIR